MAATGTNVRSWRRCHFSLKLTFKLFHKYEIKLEGPDGLPPPLPFAGMTCYLPASERGIEEWNYQKMSHWGKWLMSDEWTGDFLYRNLERVTARWTAVPSADYSHSRTVTRSKAVTFSRSCTENKSRLSPRYMEAFPREEGHVFCGWSHSSSCPISYMHHKKSITWSHI